MTFHAIYSRYMQKSSWETRTLEEAVDHIRGGEDEGLIFGIAIYDDVADLLYIARPYLLDEATARRDVSTVLECPMTTARITPFPERVEEDAKPMPLAVS